MTYKRGQVSISVYQLDGFGKNPALWIGTDEPNQMVKVASFGSKEEEILEAANDPEVFTTMSFKVRKKHLKTLRDYAYTNRVEIKEALDQALETFFATIDTSALIESPEKPKKTRKRGV